MRLSAAESLASTGGYDALGAPTPRLLLQPLAGLYFCAAHLCQLRLHRGLLRREQWVVRAYCSGPDGVGSDAAARYWQRYCATRHELQVGPRCTGFQKPGHSTGLCQQRGSR
jgi:hypothetical protein